MPTIRLFFAALVASMMLTSCDNTIDLTADWQDIPVIYAMIDGSKPTQIVRLEKVFIDPVKSAVEVAQIPDSLYYDDSTVSLFLTNKRTNKRVKLTRFDGTNEGYPRKPGVFATQPNWLYRVATSELGNIQGGDSIGVELVRNDSSLPTVTAITRVPKQMEYRSPNPDFESEPSSENYFEWEGDANAVLFNAFLIIPTRRLNAQNQIIGRDTVIWQVANNYGRGTAQTTKGFSTGVKLPAIGFYEALAGQLSPITNTDFRLFEKPRVLIQGGGAEIREFLVSSNAASGVSGAEAVPVFTNVTNGLGLVTAINQVYGPDLLIKASTINSVRIHPLTKDLKLN